MAPRALMAFALMVPGEAEPATASLFPEPVSAVPPLRRFDAELVDGLGYTRTLAVEAPSLAEATALARRFGRAHGWRLGPVEPARGEERP